MVSIGCPKPGKDTILVTVLPKVNAFAGRDTAVVVRSAFTIQCHRGCYLFVVAVYGFIGYQYCKSIGLYSSEIDSIRCKAMVIDEAGCSDSATVKVKVFITKPQVLYLLHLHQTRTDSMM